MRSTLSPRISSDATSDGAVAGRLAVLGDDLHRIGLAAADEALRKNAVDLFEDEAVGLAEAGQRPGLRGLTWPILMTRLCALTGMTLSTAGATTAPTPALTSVRREMAEWVTRSLVRSDADMVSSVALLETTIAIAAHCRHGRPTHKRRTVDRVPGASPACHLIRPKIERRARGLPGCSLPCAGLNFAQLRTLLSPLLWREPG